MRTALYCRVSGEEQKQGRNIESQLQELENFANANGYVVVGVYKDEAWSGGLLNRPELDRLRDDAAKGLFECALVNDVDRLSRDVVNLGVIKRDLEKKRVKLIFKKLPNSGGPMADFMTNILGSFAEFEKAIIADRTRRGRIYKAKVKGLIVGSKAPYGYSYVKKNKEKGTEGHYIINPKEARVVKMMFDWVANEGSSGREVVRRLNELKVSPRNGKAWRNSSVLRILHNLTYTGITFYMKYQSFEPENQNNGEVKVYRKQQKTSRRLRPKKEWIEIKLPSNLAIIDKELFNRIQEQIKQNQVFSKRNTKYFYLLSKVRRECNVCGLAYVGTPCHGRLFYRCSNRDKKEKCKAAMVSAPSLEGAIWDSVMQAIQNPKLIIEQVNNLKEKQLQQPTKIEAEIKRTEDRLSSLQKEEERVLEAYRRGITTVNQFQNEVGKLNQERTELESSLKASKEKMVNIPPREEAIKSIRHYCKVIKERANSFTPEEKQTFLGYLLDKVTIGSEKVIVHGQIPAYTVGNIAATSS